MSEKISLDSSEGYTQLLSKHTLIFMNIKDYLLYSTSDVPL